MKLFVITLSPSVEDRLRHGLHDIEVHHEARSIAEMADILKGMGLRVRAIEEIPNDAHLQTPGNDRQLLTLLPLGTAENYRIKHITQKRIFEITKEEEDLGA